MLFVVDAISSFLADDFDMADLGVDVVIAGSQKALACPSRHITDSSIKAGTEACRETSYEMYVFEFERSFEKW